MSAFPYDIPRGDWEEPGHTIAEHTNSPALDWSKITNVTIHFPGTPGEIGRATRSGFISNLRSSQRYYETARGYSYGYNAAVWDALTAEIRGEAFRCAANGNTATNTPSFAIQVRSGGSTASARGANDDEIASIRQIVAWAEGRAGRRLDILGHRDHKPTGCPGDAIYAQIQSGVFRPDATPDPDPGDPDMATPRFFKTSTTSPTVWMTTDEHTAVHVTEPQYVALGTPPVALEPNPAKFAYIQSIQHDIAI